NTLNPDLRNEKVVGLEAGYGYRSNNFNFNVNLYRTSWKDRFLSDGVRVDGVNGSANYYGIEQIHTGIEFDGVLEISPFVKVEGMLSLGNYEYGSDVTADVFNSSQQLLGSATLYLDGVKVGDAAQTTSRVNLVVTPSDLFKFNISMFNASDLYSDFNPEDFSDPTDEAMMLPAYELFDFGMSYKLNIGEETVFLRANVNNIFDNYYFAESKNNYLAGPGDSTYLGVNTRNRVFPGWGRTWNVGFTYRF
ncbi:MAG: TonB-dependent receptor domain-containing protein, partial [Flavobacteriaceae bacterium]